MPLSPFNNANVKNIWIFIYSLNKTIIVLTAIIHVDLLSTHKWLCHPFTRTCHEPTTFRQVSAQKCVRLRFYLFINMVRFNNTLHTTNQHKCPAAYAKPGVHRKSEHRANGNRIVLPSYLSLSRCIRTNKWFLRQVHLRRTPAAKCVVWTRVSEQSRKDKNTRATLCSGMRCRPYCR